MAQEPDSSHHAAETLPDAPAAAPAKQSVRSFKYVALEADREDLAKRSQEEICEDEGQV